MSARNIKFELEDLIKDDSEPLLVFTSGDITITVQNPKSLTAEESLTYSKCQIFSSAIASEYKELAEKINTVLESKKNESGMVIDREVANSYAHLNEQLLEKEIELHGWTTKYIACLSRLSEDELLEKLTPISQQRNVPLKNLVTKLFSRINDELRTVNVDENGEDLPEFHKVKEDDENPTTPTGDTLTTSVAVLASSEKSTELVG